MRRPGQVFAALEANNEIGCRMVALFDGLDHSVVVVLDAPVKYLVSVLARVDNGVASS